MAVSEAIQDLVGRLAARVSEEAEERVTTAQATCQQLEQTERALAEEKAGHSKTSKALSSRALECTQLTQQVADLQERLAAEERHRQSLEEKHQHACQALEHCRK